MKLIKFRILKDMNVDGFNADIHNSFLKRPEDFDNISNAVEIYNDVLGDLLK